MNKDEQGNNYQGILSPTMIIPPDKRKEYYERALSSFLPNAPKSKFGFSCNILWRFMADDYPEIGGSTAPSDNIVKEYLPEYYDVLKERRASTVPGSKAIYSWPTNAEGNAARCEALAEAIARVSLLITDKPTLF